MSTDERDIGTSDAMSNGHSDTSGATRFKALGDKKLQKLRTEAAELVADGILALDDIALDGYTGDGVTLADGENEAFRENIREQLGDQIDDDADDEEQAEQGEGWGPTEVDFGTIWEEYSFPEKVSDTQLVEALAVSRHTAFRRGGARRAIEYGVEAGTLVDIPRTLPEDSYGDELVVNGVMYARGDA